MGDSDLSEVSLGTDFNRRAAALLRAAATASLPGAMNPAVHRE